MPPEPVIAPTPAQSSEEAALALSERLQEAGRWSLIAELVSYISHELNQPLAAMATYAEAGSRLLSQPDPDVGRARDVQNKIARQALRAGELVRRLQLLLAPERHGTTTLDCSLIVRELMQLALPLARMRATKSRVEVAENLPPVRGDPVQLQLLLLMLFHNALDAVSGLPRNRREVAVVATRAAEGVELGVEDTGPGISDAHAPLLFQVFFTTKARGAGLGLAISSSIAARHGVTLRFTRLPDQRTRFWVTLPVAGTDAG
jgi:C4-dicarboxylate-specific signal transduction histidine kinase